MRVSSRLSAMATVASVEPSSTTMISKSPKLWRNALAIARHSVASRLKAITVVRDRRDFEQLADLTKRVDNILAKGANAFALADNTVMTGVGMLRLDFGWGQAGTKVQVGFGVFEKADAQRKRQFIWPLF